MLSGLCHTGCRGYHGQTSGTARKRKERIDGPSQKPGEKGQKNANKDHNYQFSLLKEKIKSICFESMIGIVMDVINYFISFMK